ncbi:MAG: DUF3105 domain-containing protein, partial [Acidimicrobiia bacterium]
RWLMAAVMLLGACGGSEGGEVELPVQTFRDQGVNHLTEESVQDILAGAPGPDYNSDPPTSGPHAPTWAPCGVYREPIPDIFQVHTLEHGAVLAQYRPDLPADQVAALESLARELGQHVLVAPRDGLGPPVVLTAWTVLVELPELDLEAVREFHREYAQRGPEAVPCPFEVDQAS